MSVDNGFIKKVMSVVFKKDNWCKKKKIVEIEIDLELYRDRFNGYIENNEYELRQQFISKFAEQMANNLSWKLIDNMDDEFKKVLADELLNRDNIKQMLDSFYGEKVKQWLDDRDNRNY